MNFCFEIMCLSAISQGFKKNLKTEHRKLFEYSYYLISIQFNVKARTFYFDKI